MECLRKVFFHDTAQAKVLAASRLTKKDCRAERCRFCIGTNWVFRMSIAPELSCNLGLKRHMAANLSIFAVKAQAARGATRAAVAITIVDVGCGEGDRGESSDAGCKTIAALILTRRAADLKAHAGQWALPGGRMEADESPEAAALRELQEEVGLRLPRDRVLGRLDDFTTRSGFAITPVVVWGGPAVRLLPNPAEVAAIHRIPIAEFLRADAPILENSPGGGAPILFMPVASTRIAAPTAALIYQFREVAILGRHTRVAHYGQPAFAWR